jgi:transposase
MMRKTVMLRKRGRRRLKVLYPDCAGIDVGSREMWVAVDPERTAESVRRFGTFTADLDELVQWLKALAVKQVAMEATGVYWIPLYEKLDAAGFEVQLVNSRATRQVTGRKSDVLDCQWIRELMSYGLLQGAFRPADAVCGLRALVRQHKRLVEDPSRTVLHLQKALAQMNIQWVQVVSDLTGKSGMAILRAIVAGERDPQVLARLRQRQLRADEATVAKSLHGNWREEHLFALRQALEQYDFLERQKVACAGKVDEALSGLAVVATPALDAPKGRRGKPSEAKLGAALQAMLGVDLTAIPGIGVDTALVVAWEVGADLSRFPTQEQFCSWANVAPPTRVSGGKPLPGRGPKVRNRLGQALRQAAANTRNSQSFIGAAHRSRLARMDKAAAVKATAHHLARLIYLMLTRGQPYVEKGLEVYEKAREERQLTHLRRKAARLGYQLTETPKTAVA